jgi:putative redox protein
MKTTTVWKKDQEFKSYQDEHKVKLDGNKKEGFSPKALLLSGLAACSGIDVVEILQKMKVDFSDFEIDVEAEQTEGHPKVFKEIHILYKIKTNADNKDKVKKAVDLSLEKYCGVSAMLKKNSPITYKIELK